MRSSGVATRWRIRGMSHEPRSMRVDERVPVGGPVEEQHRDDRRPQQRVLLDVPHERVGVAHVRFEALDVVRSGHGCSLRRGPGIVAIRA